MPFGLYYGRVDSTPSVGVRRRRAISTAPATRKPFAPCGPNIQAALAWIDTGATATATGLLLEYYRESENGLTNQG